MTQSSSHNDTTSSNESYTSDQIQQSSSPSPPLPKPKRELSTDTQMTFNEVLLYSLHSGAAGALAMVTNVATLMWTRTIINYQYRHGGSYPNAFRQLYCEGGIPRFYRGITFALLMGPLSRFGETAANTGTLAFCNSHKHTKDWNVWSKTAVATGVAASWKILIMPIDYFKTIMQVEGRIQPAFTKLKLNGYTVLYHGAVASMSSSIIGNYPWLFTYNFLFQHVPKRDTTLGELGRRGFIGFCASVVSDTCANSVRVTKVYKQTNAEAITYPIVVRRIIQESGVSGLFFRGLETRIMANGLQGIMFSVMWKYWEEVFSGREAR